MPWACGTCPWVSVSAGLNRQKTDPVEGVRVQLPTGKAGWMVRGVGRMQGWGWGTG